MLISLQEEFMKLNIFQIANEELYKLSDLKEKMQQGSFENFEAEDLIITPYYIDNGRLYELYAFELNIRVVGKIDFDSHLKKITGKENVEEIPEEIIDLHRHCYIEKTDSQCLSKKELQKYIFYLENSEQIRKEIQKVFSTFDKNNLYFEVY